VNLKNLWLKLLDKVIHEHLYGIEIRAIELPQKKNVIFSGIILEKITFKFWS
jgi:hypothetical protein